uniref:U-box domain-containing protein n=1 Tax=Ananas comosus var. bracteatus TaxID=296719 RepID=A0A6V7NNS8_ANACO|nr:unnamed protein product [Ananas comosus var. bracteatus]
MRMRRIISPPKLAIGFVGMRNSSRSRRILRSWSGRCGSRRRRQSSSASPRAPSRGLAASRPARDLRVGLRSLDSLKFLRTSDDCGAMSGGGRVRAGRGPCPEFFLCPISKRVMREPVVIASGKTFERSAIEKWLDEGNRTCPLTDQVLPNTILIRDLQIAKLISSWRSLYKCKRGQVRDDEVPIELHERIRSNFYGLVYAVTSDDGLKREEAIKAFRDLHRVHKRSVNYLLSKKPRSSYC